MSTPRSASSGHTAHNSPPAVPAQTPPNGGAPRPGNGPPAPLSHQTTVIGAVPRSDSRAAAGTVVGGRYTLTAPVGSGGMGTVWRASDRLLRREVAVKEVIPPPNMPAEERAALAERTLREARAAAGLSHPSVVRVYDVVTDGGRPWIVMELLKAHSLAELIERDGPLAPRAVAKIGLAMLGALEAAHAAGVLHRDVKPGNVLICADGRCVLTDFGVARSLADSDMTTPGMVLGSPHFISPERATGGRFGPPSDLFSLGVTLYAAVEGRAPYDRGDAIATMNAVVNEPPEPPQRAGDLTPVLYGLLEKDPAKRWDVDRTRETLRALLLGGPSAPNPARAPDAAAPLPRTPNGAVAAAPMSPAPAQGAADGWVGRATVPSPAAAAEPLTAYGGYPPPPRVTSYAAAGGGRRAHGPWLFGAAAILVALALVFSAVGFSSGWFDSGADTAKDTPKDPARRNLNVTSYQGQGVTVNVPEGWRQRNVKHYVEFHDPKHRTSWLRINVTRDGRSAMDILRGADRGFGNGCCGLTDYRQVSMRDARLGGKRGAELEYTATKVGTGEARHGLWRIVVVNGVSYQVYMSVPEDRFKPNLPLFREAARTFKITG